MLNQVRLHIALRLLIFLAVFAVTALLLIFLPTTNAFWRVMDLRFSKDERYQIQSLFLPDRKRLVPLAVVGDSMFQAAVTAQAGPFDHAQHIVINGYDSEDVGSLLTAIWYGEAHTKTRICTLVIQISPNFVVRAKSQHVLQSFDLLPTYRYAEQAKRGTRVKSFFTIIDRWFHTQDDGDLMSAPHLRVASHIGQARFADPTEENWKRAFMRLKRTKARVLGVLDIRGTDWGENGNLVQETERSLTKLSEDAGSFSWMRLEDFRKAAVPDCNQRAVSSR